ncbi:MAG: insulinase family protein, partial [Oscillospiraceae bacterium]|nr:insulinase family protein [Oscillospiraceae bacterium]
VLPKQAGPIAQKDYGPQELPQVARAVIEERMVVSNPIFQLGFKGDAPEKGQAGLRQQLVGELACECLLGTSSPLYASLYREGLINQGFAYGYEAYPGCAFLMAGGESKDPLAVREAIWKEAARISREGLDAALWERVKKGVYGGKVRSLNSFENLCVGQAQNFFLGADALAFPEAFDSLTAQDARQLLERWVTPERTAMSVVRPKDGT